MLFDRVAQDLRAAWSGRVGDAVGRLATFVAAMDRFCRGEFGLDGRELLHAWNCPTEGLDEALSLGLPPAPASPDADRYLKALERVFEAVCNV